VDTPRGKPVALYAVIIVAALAGVVWFQPSLLKQYVGIDLHVLMGEESETTRDPAAAGPARVQREGRLGFGGVGLDMEVWINGRKQDYSIGKQLSVNVGRPLRVSVKKVGFKAYTQEVTLSEETPHAFVEVPALEPARNGMLSSSQNYAKGSILVYEVDGERFERPMPFSDVAIPRGEYQAVVTNPFLGTEKPVKFIIEENKVQLLE
jgi:hypothetical protein